MWKDRLGATLDLDSEEGELFVMMAGMGFFLESAHICRAALPLALTLEAVKNAALALAGTEDDEYMLHPEQLVPCMSSGEAKILQKQLELFRESQKEQPYHLQ